MDSSKTEIKNSDSSIADKTRSKFERRIIIKNEKGRFTP